MIPARHLLRTTVASLALALAASAAAQTGLAFTRAQHLKRGVNLSMWYAQSSDYSAARLAAFTTPADFQLIHHLGFDHVRLSIDPVPLITNPTLTRCIARCF